MFANSITLQGIPQPLSITDTDNGRTVRQFNAGGGIFYQLIIARSESKENKVVLTDRYLVQTNVIAPDSEGRPIRASCSTTLSYPRHPAFTHVTLTDMYKANVNFIIGTFSSGTSDIIEDNLARVFNGES